jgi:hypothetical protein
MFVIPNPRLLRGGICFTPSFLSQGCATTPLRYILIATHVDTGFEALANPRFSRHQLR